MLNGKGADFLDGVDNQQSAPRELALFAGAGGGILGGVLLGWRTICAVEIDAYAASVLVSRQNDGALAPFPIWDDVRTFDGRPWRGRVDVVSCGFPCQDVSAAGRGAGIDGERSGLWRQAARIISEVRPFHVFVENSPRLTRRGLWRVLGDLASLGYDARWGVLGACDAGAPHRRERIWVVATYAYRDRWGEGRFRGDKQSGRAETPGGDRPSANTARERWLESWPWREGWEGRIEAPDGSDATPDVASQGLEVGPPVWSNQFPPASGSHWWSVEPNVGRMVHGIPARVDRIKVLGNAQVPSVAALAWRILTK